MDIQLLNRMGFELIFKAENVNVVEDIEERIYSKDENGKTDFSIPPQRDINTSVLEQFCRLLEDMVYYRQREFDSTNLIEQLLEKMPSSAFDKFLEKFCKEYDLQPIPDNHA